MKRTKLIVNNILFCCYLWSEKETIFSLNLASPHKSAVYGDTLTPLKKGFFIDYFRRNMLNSFLFLLLSMLSNNFEIFT